MTLDYLLSLIRGFKDRKLESWCKKWWRSRDGRDLDTLKSSQDGKEWPAKRAGVYQKPGQPENSSSQELSKIR